MRVSVCLCVCVCVCVCVVHVRTVKESLFNLGARQREPVEIDDSDLPQEVHQPAANRNIVNQAHACCLHACVCVCVCVYICMYTYICIHIYTDICCQQHNALPIKRVRVSPLNPKP